MSKLLQNAEQISKKAHKGQTRRDGYTPYMNHIEAVVNRVRNAIDHGTEDRTKVIAVAYLHDVLEDTAYTEADLRMHGMPDEVIEGVVAMTKCGFESYDEYLNRVMDNSFARQVKVHDILHNLSDKPTQIAIRKYAKALLILTTPSGPKCHACGDTGFEDISTDGLELVVCECRDRVEDT